MNYLLDTHALLWVLFEPSRLGDEVLQIVQPQRKRVHASTVSLWEISLKYGIGKLELLGVGPEQLPEAIRQSRIDLLALDADDASSFHRLPRSLHKDPFDRMLAWQAIRHHMALLSCDSSLASAFESYGLQTIW
jgi:PIN domain nuclease of toxin-antitoxin system